MEASPTAELNEGDLSHMKTGKAGPAWSLSRAEVEDSETAPAKEHK